MVTKASAAKKANIPVDSVCPLQGASVHEDYDCMLNQTNIGANNNKFYVIQLLEKGGKYYAWTRWGRVGEDGQNALIGPVDLGKALKAFQAKFKDKTKNAWEDRADFKPAAGRYTLIEVDRSADASKAEEIEEKLKGIDADAAKIQAKTAKKFAPCKLARRDREVHGPHLRRGHVQGRDGVVRHRRQEDAARSALEDASREGLRSPRRARGSDRGEEGQEDRRRSPRASTP